MTDLLRIFKANQNLPGAPSWTDQQFVTECETQGVLTANDPSGRVQAFIFFRKTPEALEISYLATDPEAKRQGLMFGLLHKLSALATVQKIPIWIEVHEGNSQAIKLYEKFGFRRTGMRPRYYADGGSALLYNYG